MSSQLVCRSLHRRWKEETLICLISTGCWNICAGVLICALATIMQNTSLPLIGQSFFFSSYKKSISMPNSIVYWIGINVELCDQNKRFKIIVQNVLYSCLRATVFSSSIQNGFSKNCTQVLRSPWKWMWNWT